MAAGEVLLEAEGLGKRFGATVALAGVDLVVRRGERVAIMGENGAGKSTLMKLIAGVHRPDEGSMKLDGHDYRPGGPSDALAAGVSIVYQEPAFFAPLSVLENLYAGRQPRTRLGNVDVAGMRRDGRKLFAELGLPEGLLGARMDRLSLGEQQQVLIARAVATETKLLILDEPTSILTDAEARTLFELVDRLTARGTAVCYITHRFEELERVADRFVVLRDGRPAGELDGPDEERLLAMMGGGEKKATAREPMAPGVPHREPLLELRGLSAGGAFSGVDLDVRPGEIVGLYGLVGSGRTEIALTVFGLLRPSAGEMLLDGARHAPKHPREALGRGVGYLPEDRKTQGLFAYMTVRENLSAAGLDRLSGRLGVLARGKERDLVQRWRDRLRIKTSGTDAPITSLSGGNQQKVLLARSMATEPRLLMLDEPTRGIDVATKAEIHQDIAALAASGVAVLLISSELPELLGLAGRVYVLHEGRVTAHLDRAEADEKTVLRATMGVAS